MAYIFLFCGSILLFTITYFFKKYHLKLLSNFLILVNTYIVSLFAGLRQLTIGTDVLYYMVPSYNYASLYTTFSAYRNVYNFEFLYAALTYFLNRITSGNTVIFLFILTAIPLIFIECFVFNQSNKISSIFAYSLYLLGFFNLSLNYSRQFIAIGIAVFSLQFLLKSKYLLFIIGIIIATLFHNSAILFFLLILFKWISKFSKRRILFFNSLLIILTLIISAFYNNFINFFISRGIIANKYSAHLSQGIQFQIAFLVFHIIILLMTFILLKKTFLKEEEQNFLIEIIFMCVLLLLFSFLSDSAVRIEINLFVIVCVYIIPRVIKQLKVNFREKVLIKMSIIILFLINWIITIVIQNNGQTFPYLHI